MSIKETYFQMGYKKLLSVPWTMEEKKLLDEIDSPFIDMSHGLCGVVKHIFKKDTLDHLDLSILKLSLSGIINLINPSHRERLKPFIDFNEKKEKLSSWTNVFKLHGMNHESRNVYARIMEIINTESSENVSIFIAKLKISYLESRNHHCQTYKMLKILEQVLDFINDWREDDSETTCYRRFGGIMDHLFRGSDVRLADGETACKVTRSKKQYNGLVYDPSVETPSIHGRKIDLLIKYGDDDVEISSNEFKKYTVTPNLASSQQCKNLRVNGAILDSLQRLSPMKTIDGTVAMDWIGHIGYMFAIIDINDIYYAQKIDIIIMPKSTADLAQFETTLDLLFCYHHFIINKGQEAQVSLSQRKNLDRLCFIYDNTDSSLGTFSQHDIFFTPKQERVLKKPKI
ncbi:unnamed protein product [Rhizopus stolonifer]